MKTSFYFVLWIIIYPILGLLNIPFIDNNSFIVALAVVWGLSWLLNRIMPDTLTYERASSVAPLLEDVYTGNVQSFKKRLSRETLIETITAAYFCATTIVIGFAVLKAGVNDWIALGIFAFFTIGAIVRAANLIKAYFSLNNNPTPEQCMEIADETYKMDYSSYYEARQTASYNDMLPPRPTHFKAFQWVSVIIALIASLLGLIFIASGIITMLSYPGIVEAQALACMYFLYGSLATYFGVKDLISIYQSLRNKSNTIES